MKVLLIIASISSVNLTAVDIHEMDSLPQCVKLREALVEIFMKRDRDPKLSHYSSFIQCVEVKK